LLLEGDRGAIIWWSEDCINWDSPDYELTPKAQALAPVLKELQAPLARLILRAERVRDPLYIHYSQPSIQVAWLMESTVDGSTWLRRFSSYEADHNQHARIRAGWLKAFQDLGFSPQFISSEQIQNGRLSSLPAGALVLPGAWALSDKEAAAILTAKATGKWSVLFDGTPGVFDHTGKLRARSPLEDLWSAETGTPQGLSFSSKTASARLQSEIRTYGSSRLVSDPPKDLPAWLSEQLGTLKPTVEVPLTARVRVHRFRLAKAGMVAFERNINYHMSEDLKQAGGNEQLEASISFEARLPARTHVYDLNDGKYLGETDVIRCNLDPWKPSIYALTPTKYPEASLIRDLTPP
jgi:hypothetical protein